MQSDGPILYAALLCQRVYQDEDGVSTLFRVVDIFNSEVGSIQENSQEISPKVAAEVECILFTKWGGPASEYTERITLMNTQRKERDLNTEGVTFKLNGGHHFQQIRHGMHLRVSESGLYAFRVYLNDQHFIDVPFQVNIRVSPQARSRE